MVVADSAVADGSSGLPPLPPNTLPPAVLPFDPTGTHPLGILVAGNGKTIKVTYDVRSLLGENPLVHELYSAGIEITLDRVKLAKVGLTAVDVASLIEEFFKNHRTFKLSELQALKLPDANDSKICQLKDFATIDMDFRKTTPQPSAPEASAPRKVSKELLEKRLEAARKVFEQNLVRLKGAQALPSELFGWSERWLDAELALAEKPADRVKALRDHFDRTREVERAAVNYAKTGQGRQADADAATYYRLEAEIRLLKEGLEPHPAKGDKGKPDNK